MDLTLSLRPILAQYARDRLQTAVYRSMLQVAKLFTSVKCVEIVDAMDGL